MPARVDIVLPCYNPGENWSLELLKFHKEASVFYDIRYVLVNDGSSATTLESKINQLRQQEIPIEVISYAPNKGKGYALRKGVAESKADYTVYTDIDFPFTNNSMMTLMNVLVNEQKDVVAGFRSEAYYQKNMTGFRVLLSKSFRFFLRKIVKLPVSDTQCGLKGFNLKGREKFLNTTINRYLFDFEFIYASCRDTSLKMATVEVTLKENVVFRSMKLKILLQETINLCTVLLFKRN